MRAFVHASFSPVSFRTYEFSSRGPGADPNMGVSRPSEAACDFLFFTLNTCHTPKQVRRLRNLTFPTRAPQQRHRLYYQSAGFSEKNFEG